MFVTIYSLFKEFPEVTLTYWVLRWPTGSTSVSHQCGLGSIPGWGSDPSAVSEKGLSSPV